MIQRRVFVSGRVQGVGFRASTIREAARHASLRGCVRNLPDGRVEAIFHGEERAVLEMVAWCAHGPSAARVSQLDVREENPDSSLPVFGIG